MMALIDKYGRKHNYLRISVTDRCNLRCLYCMGEDGVEQLAHDDILSYEDILKVIRAGAELGITKVRITGGEPLVRKNLSDLIRGISATSGISDISMTTNGILLSRFAGDLKKAGLNRVNISLDSMQEEKYRHITRCGDLTQVLEGIDEALKQELNPVKLNVVLINGFNDSEIPDFLNLILDKPLHVRFIEYMPIGDHDSSYSDHYLPLTIVEETAEKIGLPLKPFNLPDGAGPADSYTISGAKGTIGLIHPISKHFCKNCNRLRLTADGNLKACLYWQEEVSVKPFLGDKEALKELFYKVINEKHPEHKMDCSDHCGEIDPGMMRTMSKTGG